MARSTVTSIPEYLKSESARLQTFQNGWPHSDVSPVHLANAGFYFLSVDDKVQCVFCYGVLMNWEPGRLPYNEHYVKFPMCPFVLGKSCGNVPLGRNPVRPTLMLLHNSVPDQQYCENSVPMVPEHSMYSTKESRLRSYLFWPDNAPVDPEELAAAGFYYTGSQDSVKCFSCKGTLCKWKRSDIPWIEHRKYFPRCDFVISNTRRVTECISSVSTPLSTQPDERLELAMQSNLIKAFLRIAGETSPPDIVRLALDKKIKETGATVKNMDELCNAIQRFKREQMAILNETKDHQIVQSEVEEIKGIEDSLCKICFVRPKDVVFLPCRHLISCGECSLAIESCPICREIIIETIKAFMS